MEEEIKNKLDIKEEKKLATRFTIEKLRDTLESEESATAFQKLKKNINIEKVSLEESAHGKNITVGEISIITNDSGDELSDMFNILEKISKNGQLMKYLRGEKKRVPTICQ